MMYIYSIAIIAMTSLLISISAEHSSHDALVRGIMEDINQHKVMVYSKSYCPFSRRLKALLKNYDIHDIKVVELDHVKQTQEMQDILKELSGRRTVPQLFVEGSFVGGFSETNHMDEKGELRPMLERARAL